MILLAHIVHRRGQTSHADAAWLEQHVQRHARPSGDDLGVRRLRSCHPDRYRQRPAIRAAHDIVGLVIPLIKSDYWQAMCTQGMESVVDRDLRSTMLMGSMWVSCLRR